jgi:signal transduction histidine kinase
MPIVEPELAPLRIPQLAALATSAWPAWLWRTDASRILWANAVGAAIFGAANATECGKRRFAAKDPSTAQIIRLAATLPSAAQERLERLRGFGAGFGGALICACSRVVLPDGTAAVLVAATEPAGPALPLGERVRRLFPDGAGALAVFAPDGSLLHATATARQRLGGITTLPALGIQALAAKALEAGHASGVACLGQTRFEVTAARLGKDGSRVLVLTLPPQPSEAVPTVRAAERSELAPAAPALEGGAEAPPAPATAAASTAAEPPPSPQAASHDGPITERRHPLRFVWQMDADGRFVVGSNEFIELVGLRTTAACGRLWSEIAAELKLDPDDQVARAIATHETWSGILISWPADELSERLPVELSGLPVFDRDRAFRGYRGFGVCRDIARINQLTRARRARSIGVMPVPEMIPPDGDSAPPPQSVAAADMSAAAASPPTAEESPALNVAPASANVVPFRPVPPAPTAPPGPPPEAKAPSLSAVERKAFRELAQELTARLRGTEQGPAAAESALQESPVEEQQAPVEAAAAPAAAEAAPAASGDDVAPRSETAEHLAASVALIAADAHGATDAQPQKPPVAERVLLDRIPAGVLVYRNDLLIYANRRFLEWSGYGSLDALAAAGGVNSLFVEPGTGALAESGSIEPLSIMTQRGDKLAVDGRLFTVPWDGACALALVLTSGQADERLRATQRALGAAENEIRELKSILDRTAKREAQKAAAAKADFLAKVSHEIRTPLNAMIGFAEVIMAERFGSIGNERYREYLKDMHAAGTHLVSLLNDLLDLSKIETGQLDLTFADVDLNDLTRQCVAIMQPQANRARIIIRTSLTPGLPEVVADERSLRQIVLNLLSNAIKFTGPGGQVIVSTAAADGAEAVLRVRDTGVGMSEKDIEAALEPFRQTATSGSWGSGGTGLGLPLTKALAEANHANFSIKSAANAGTLVEIAFPPTRIAAG